jgi:Lipocalin-like domain
MKFPDALVAISALLAGCAAAEGEVEQTSGIADAIVGSWRLVEWVVTDQYGEQVFPFGRTPEGLLIYTSGGEMSVQLLNPDLSVAESSAESETLEDVLSRFFAYYGTYSIDEAAMTITHSVAGSLAPSWIGSEQVREYEMVDENRLRLTARLPSEDVLASAGAGGTNVVVWDRIGGISD